MSQNNPKLPKFRYNLLRNSAPKGYRFLTLHETVLNTDLYYHCYGGSSYTECAGSGLWGQKIVEIEFLKHYPESGYIRKIE